VWKDDLLEGPFTSWHRSGKKRAEGRYCQAAQCGPWIAWDQQGRELGRSIFEERKATP
jgi:antitoxin component YwqK of YwqJK toxin-antitoxin module